MRQHSEEKRTRPLLLVWFTNMLSSKTCQWHVLDVQFNKKHHERTITMKTFLKVLASIIISALYWQISSYVLVFSLIIVVLFSAPFNITSDIILTVASVILAVVILCMLNLLTYNLLKKLVQKSLWVYIIQSGNIFTAYLLFTTLEDVSVPSYVPDFSLLIDGLFYMIVISIIGGVLLSAIIRTIKQRRTKSE